VSRLAVRDKVHAGTPGTEDYDTGRVVAVDGDQVEVAWSNGTRTIQSASLLSLDPDAQCATHGCAQHRCRESH